MARNTSAARPGTELSGARPAKVTLGIGFAALLVGTIMAHRSPADGYELSIYEATPMAFWLGVAVAVAASAGVAVFAADRRLVRDGALLLGITSVASVVLLPLIRGYYYFGAGDSLTHLGWMHDIATGTLDPFNLLYPGIHTTGIFVARVLDLRLGLAQMYVVIAYVLAFVAFVGLTVALLGRTRLAVPIGLFAGLLLLPNNNISVHLMAHPVTQSLLLTPAVLFLSLLYVRQPGEFRVFGVTPVGVLLSTVVVALVLIHPQGALNVVLSLAAISAVQFYFRRFRGDNQVDDHRPLYLPTIVGAAAFAVWAPRHERVTGALEGVASSLAAGSAPTGEIAERSTSLTELGGSILELFVVLFLPATIFVVLAAALLYALYTGRLADRTSDREALLSYVAIGLVPLTALFMLFFVANVGTQHFRYAGFIMVPVTVLGAVAIDYGIARGAGTSPDWTRSFAVVAALLLLLPLPLATIHASPFIYQPTYATSQMELEGTETTVEYMDRDTAFVGFRGGPNRELNGVYGTEGTNQLNVDGTSHLASVPFGVWGMNMTEYYDSDRYLPVSSSDYAREVRLYQGLRYSEQGFQRLNGTPGVNRVHTNGDYKLYLVENEDAE